MIHLGVWDLEKNQLDFVGVTSDPSQFIGGVSLRKLPNADEGMIFSYNISLNPPSGACSRH
jgi:hypothetical protein